MGTSNGGDIDSIAIVATGPSVANLTRPDADCVIAVNAAIELVTPDIWFTLDLSLANRTRVYAPIPGVRYVVACGPRCRHRDQLPGHVRILRRIEGSGASDVTDLASYWFCRWRAKAGLSEDPGAIHTGNSVYGALGLAYHMRPRRIVLYGLDGTQERRATGGKPNRLDHLPMLFASAVPQLQAAGIDVRNANPASRIDCFAPLEAA